MCLLRTSLVLLMGICFVTNASAQKNTAPDPPNSPLATNQSEGLKFFAETIRPVFEQNCVECHGGKATRSGFNLLTQAGLLKGGDNGEAIVPRDPESSRMLKLLRHTEDPGMPYKKPALDDAIISTIARWIALGAPYAGPLKAVKRGEKLSESFWAVKPLVEPKVPKADSSWGRSPIDAFILAKLTEKKLSPSSEADRRTLIRRLTYDLHGLPPTPEEIEAFLNDQDPDAYEKLVDHLLASPRYGERWARHWLDVVHYADTHGYDKDKRRPNAWPYRDYVIKSLNDDKPYGKFATEQLAGDVLFPEDPDAIVATGFIAAGPWDLVGHSELKEDTMDKKITRLLDRDDMVANTFSTFSSLTVHCARCHNHKFDPIPQKDYYALHAVFAGVDRADRLFDPDKELHKLRRALSAEQVSRESELATLERIRSGISSARIRVIDAERDAMERQIAISARLPSALPATGKGFQSKVAHSRYQTKWVQVDLGQPFTLEKVALLPVNWKHGTYPGPGFGFPQRFKIEVANDSDFKTARLIADETATDFPNPGDAPYLADAKGAFGRYIRVTATRLWREDPKTNDWLFALSEVIAISDGKNVARGMVATASDSHNDSPVWHTRNLVDGASSHAFLFDPSPTDGYQSTIATNMDAPKWVQLDLGQPFPIDHVALFPARPSDAPEEIGFGFPVRFRIQASNDPEFRTAETIADKTSGDVDNPGTRPLSFPAKSTLARYVRITAKQLWKQKEKDLFLFALSEVQVMSGHMNVARQATVSATDSREQGRWSARNLVDGFSSLATLADLSPGDGFASKTATIAETTKWLQFDLGKSEPLDFISLVPARSFESMGQLGFGFPVRFRIEISDDATLESPKVLADFTRTNFPNPGSQIQTFNAEGTKGRFVRITATQLWKKDTDEFLFALGEVEIQSGKINLAPYSAVTASDSLEKERWGARFIADGYSNLTHLHEPIHPAGYESAPSRKARATKWVQLDLGKTYPLDTARLFPVCTSLKDPETSGFPLRFRVEISNEADFSGSRPVVFETRTNLHLTNAFFEIACGAVPARYVRITATRLAGAHRDYRLRLGEVQVLSEGWNVARLARVRAFDSEESSDWSPEFLVDGFDRKGLLPNTVDVLRVFEQQQTWRLVELNMRARHDAELATLLDEPAKSNFAQVKRQLDELDTKLGGLAPQKAVFAAANDFPEEGTFTAQREPRPIYLLARGDVNQPGEVMRPGALSCVTNLSNEFELSNPSDEGERRVALARWITDPRNAITWRSIVNRVWSYHFGRGIVDTPNDFGNMGSTPTHSELLDWLAAEFLAHGQSLKWLQKQIVTSATYRQASTFREDFARIDSGNQFLWRMNRERLDAESIRDSILSISGKLDPAGGGPGYDLFEFKDDPSPHYFYERHQVDEPKVLRRSIYRFVVRSVPDPLMETLDCADPSQSVPVRNTTITALQALSLLNNPFVVRMSELCAERLQHFSKEPSRQIEEAFLLLFGRKPNQDELKSLTAYTTKYGLPNTCRLLFNSNEFLFID